MRFLVLATLAGMFFQSAVFAADTESDFEYYRTRVEPIFLKHRPTHGRCVTCHAGRGTGFMLQELSPGATTWTEEQSRKNYEVVSQLVQPGDPTDSPLLMHPLALEAGGDLYHSGGRQFASQSDPDFVTIAEWIRQKPKMEYKNLTVLKSPDRLMETMRFFDLSLRSDCAFCHVPGNFASDNNPHKAMARRMVQMTETIDQTVGKNRVTCFTCHRGDPVPKTLHPSYPRILPE